MYTIDKILLQISDTLQQCPLLHNVTVGNASLSIDTNLGQVNVTCDGGYGFLDADAVKVIDCFDCNMLGIGWQNKTANWECVGELAFFSKFCS